MARGTPWRRREALGVEVRAASARPRRLPAEIVAAHLNQGLVRTAACCSRSPTRRSGVAANPPGEPTWAGTGFQLQLFRPVASATWSPPRRGASTARGGWSPTGRRWSVAIGRLGQSPRDAALVGTLDAQLLAAVGAREGVGRAPCARSPPIPLAPESLAAAGTAWDRPAASCCAYEDGQPRGVARAAACGCAGGRACASWPRRSWPNPPIPAAFATWPFARAIDRSKWTHHEAARRPLGLGGEVIQDDPSTQAYTGPSSRTAVSRRRRGPARCACRSPGRSRR